MRDRKELLLDLLEDKMNIIRRKYIKMYYNKLFLNIIEYINGKDHIQAYDNQELLNSYIFFDSVYKRRILFKVL